MGKDPRPATDPARSPAMSGGDREQVEQWVESDPSLVPRERSALLVESAVLEPAEVAALLGDLDACLERASFGGVAVCERPIRRRSRASDPDSDYPGGATPPAVTAPRARRTTTTTPTTATPSRSMKPAQTSMGCNPPRKEPAMNLTPRQLDVIVAIRNYRHLHGYSPTMQELADQLGTSKVTIFEHVGALEKKRVLRRDKHKARSLEIVSDERLPDEDRSHQAPAARQHRRRLAHRGRREPRGARPRDSSSTPRTASTSCASAATA